MESPKGEIDVIAIIQNLILVVECKAPTFKIDARELVQDLKDFQTWEKKVESKVEWVEMHKGQIFERIVGGKTKVSDLSVEGVIITHRPFYAAFGAKFDTIFWHDFPNWLRKLNWVRVDKGID